MARRLRFLLPLLLLSGLGAAGTGEEAPGTQADAEIRPQRPSCCLCSTELPVPVHHLNEAEIESLGMALHTRNLRSLARIDSLYERGYFGPRGSKGARLEAERGFKILASNVMDYIAEMSLLDGRVLEFDEASIARPFAELFANPGVYPFLTLSRGRTGLGSFCMEYRFEDGYRHRYALAGRSGELRAGRIRVGEAKQRVLQMDYPSGLHDVIELLYEPLYCGQVFRRVIEDRGDTLDLITIEQIEGSYVRKAGVHRIAGFAYWRSRIPRGRGPWRPGGARVGAVAYLPSIHLRLPLFLPDIGLEDLRNFDLPQPLWALGYLQNATGWPEWLRASVFGLIDGWEGEGPRPAVLDEIFPDL